MGGLDIVAEIVEVCESEEVVTSLVNLAATQGRHLALLALLVHYTIQATGNFMNIVCFLCAF